MLLPYAFQWYPHYPHYTTEKIKCLSEMFVWFQILIILGLADELYRIAVS